MTFDLGSYFRIFR